MIEWKDATSYSRGEDHSSPRCWELQLEKFRLVIVYGHIYYPKEWVVHFYPLFDTFPLKAHSEKEAKIEALELVIPMIKKCLDDLSSALLLENDKNNT